MRFARSTSSWAVSSRTLPMSLRNSCSESVVMSGFRSSAAALRRLPRLRLGALGVGRRRLRRVEVVDHLDALALEVAVELLDVALVDVDLGQRLGDLAVGDDALGLALGDEVLDLLELLKFRDQHRLAGSSFLVWWYVKVCWSLGLRGLSMLRRQLWLPTPHDRRPDPVRRVQLPGQSFAARDEVKRVFES